MNPNINNREIICDFKPAFPPYCHFFPQFFCVFSPESCIWLSFFTIMFTCDFLPLWYGFPFRWSMLFPSDRCFSLAMCVFPNQYMIWISSTKWRFFSTVMCFYLIVYFPCKWYVSQYNRVIFPSTLVCVCSLVIVCVYQGVSCPTEGGPHTWGLTRVTLKVAAKKKYPHKLWITITLAC